MMSSKIMFEVDRRSNINGQETDIGLLEGIEMLRKLIDYKENDFESYERNDESNYAIPFETYYFEKKYFEIFVRDIKEELYKDVKLYRREVKDFQERVMSIAEIDVENQNDIFLEKIDNLSIFIYGGKVAKYRLLLKELKRTTGII